MGATNTLYWCVNSQSRLDDLLTQASNPLAQMKEVLGTTEALTSAMNVQGFNQFPINIPNRARATGASNRKVVIQGRVKGCPTVTDSIDVCVGASAEGSDLVDEEVTVDNLNAVKFTLDRALYKDTCDDPTGNSAGVSAYKIAEAIEQILIAENTEHVTALLAATTTYFDGTNSDVGSGTEKDIPLYSSTAPIVPQPGNLWIVQDEYLRKGYKNIKPLAIGGTTLGRWAFDANIFVGNETGSNINAARPIFPTYVDYTVDSEAADGASHLLTFIPGHAQRVLHIDYLPGDPLRRSNGEITYNTITANGEVFSIVVYDTNCDHEVDVTIYRYSDLWTLDSTFASSTCGGEETILNWDLTCADTTCSDIQRPGNIIT